MEVDLIMKRIKSKKVIQKKYVICNDSYKRGREEGYKRDENHSDKDHIHWGLAGIIIARVFWILIISLVVYRIDTYILTI